jgi:hypothetical protein
MVYNRDSSNYLSLIFKDKFLLSVLFKLNPPPLPRPVTKDKKSLSISASIMSIAHTFIFFLISSFLIFCEYTLFSIFLTLVTL